jgi:hypothetical protein
MARIVQSLTQPLEEYDQQIQRSFVRDVDSVIQKLNTSFQQDLKDESESEAFFLA